MNIINVMHDPFLPRGLKPGDTIAVIHPAGPIRNTSAYEQGLRIIKDAGLNIFSTMPTGTGPDYLAADDSHRIQEFHATWEKNDVKALIAARGGYGCLRIINHLDHKLIKRFPKLLIGFSDMTVLLNGLHVSTGIIGLHGPVVTSLHRLKTDSLEVFFRQLSGQYPSLSPRGSLEIIRSGKGSGKLIGGNLATLTHLAGTPWLPDFSGNILLLEDTGEPAYKLDRMLTQLYYSGHLENLGGLILGVFDPGHADNLQTLRLQEHVWNRTLELTKGTQYPVWGGFPSGHQGDFYSLPIGMQASMDSMNATLDFFPPVTAGT